MALTSALFTGLSGLDVNQTRLGVVGNNIANANTVAFKSSRALFKSQFYVTDSAGTSPGENFGGTNPNQRGLGATVASIDRDFTGGSIEPTGKPTDMAIEGSGFFVVKGAEQRFTRDGSFTLNPSNELVTASGDFVQGYAADADGNVNASSLGKLTIPLGASTTAKATSKVTLQGNLNSHGDVAKGASILGSQLLTTVGGTAAPTAATLLTDVANNTAPGTAVLAVGDKFSLQGKVGDRVQTPPREFEVTAASTVGDLMTFMSGGMGVDTTVPDDGDPATPAPGGTIETDATVPTAARLMLTGNLGKENSLDLKDQALARADGSTPFTFSETTNNAGIKSGAAGESKHTSFEAYDSLGNPVNVDVTAVLESQGNDGSTWRFYASSGDDSDSARTVGTGTLHFDTSGLLTDSTNTAVTINRDGTGAKEPLTVNLDFGAMTSLAADDSDMAVTGQDGYQVGTLTNFSIGDDGKIQGSYSNGQSKAIGQLAIATFANQGGLVDQGGNQFASGADSGLPVISTPQTLGSGSIRGASLEQSNVDLSKEFVNLIISSTGFSAASRVITTSDQLITELLNSAR